MEKTCFAVIVMEKLRQHTPFLLFFGGGEDEGQFAVQY